LKMCLCFFVFLFFGFFFFFWSVQTFSKHLPVVELSQISSMFWKDDSYSSHTFRLTFFKLCTIVMDSLKMCM
jgi:hypothetical protein